MSHVRIAFLEHQVKELLHKTSLLEIDDELALDFEKLASSHKQTELDFWLQFKYKLSILSALYLPCQLKIALNLAKFAAIKARLINEPVNIQVCN